MSYTESKDRDYVNAVDFLDLKQGGKVTLLFST